MNLIIERDGTIRGIYGEETNLALLGPLHISRASHVEPDAQGNWWADLAPIGGPCLGPYVQRSQALDAERVWLDVWLTQTRSKDATAPFRP